MRKANVPSEKPGKPKEETEAIEFVRWKTFNAQTLIGFVGAVACYAWLFMALALPVFLPSTIAVDSLMDGWTRLCFVLGASLSLCCVWLCADAFAKRTGLCYALSVACGCAGFLGLALGAAASAELLMISNFSLGVGAGLLYPQYGDFISAHFYAQIKDYVHGFFACAVAVCCPLLFLEGSVRLWIAACLVAIAYIAYGIAQFAFRSNGKSLVEKAESDARQSVSWRSYLSTATAAMVCGYALGCIISLWPKLTFAHYLMMAIAVLGTCLVLVVDSFHKQRINETLMMRFFLPVSAVAVLPLLLVEDTWKSLFATVLLCWSIIPLSCSIVAMFKHVIICELATLRSFSFGRLVTFLGILFGMTISFAGFLPEAVASSSHLATTFSVVVFILIVVFSASFVMVEDNFPVESNFHIRNEDGETRIEVEPGTPIRKIDQSPDATQIIEEIVVSESMVFHAKCDAVALAFGLSNRQREVLAMLAKGRNGEYITEKLVISPHTAKAHIYNIYQKTGVHSRQELMDLVENAEYDKEKLCEAAKATEG